MDSPPDSAGYDGQSASSDSGSGGHCWRRIWGSFWAPARSAPRIRLLGSASQGYYTLFQGHGGLGHTSPLTLSPVCPSRKVTRSFSPFSKMVHLVRLSKLPFAKDTTEIMIFQVFHLHVLPREVISLRGNSADNLGLRPASLPGSIPSPTVRPKFWCHSLQSHYSRRIIVNVPFMRRRGDARL